MHDGAASNDLLDRLAREPTLGLSRHEIDDATDARSFVGRAPEQVDEFLSEILRPALAGSEEAPSEGTEIRV
jgi:adenylosuccinate lyase